MYHSTYLGRAPKGPAGVPVHQRQGPLPREVEGLRGHLCHLLYYAISYTQLRIILSCTIMVITMHCVLFIIDYTMLYYVIL